MNDAWNPNQYEKFKAERAQPFWDLVELIEPNRFKRVVDLGCGTGELTRELHTKFDAVSTLGIDSSPQMLEKAKAFPAMGLEFQLSSIEDFHPTEPFDLVFSNAALQWVPDHERVLPRILRLAGPSGQVAIQVPANFDHPSHRIAEEVARDLFPNLKFESHSSSVLPLDRYATLLYENGFRKQRCRMEVYGHPMSSGSDVIEWTKGTLLTRYQKRLAEAEFKSFLEAYRERLLSVIGTGPYFYPFKRILVWGRRSA